VIPAYNLGKRLIQQLVELKNMMDSDLKYEIIVVNDGSTDSTLTLVQKEAESDKHVHIISYAQNKGKGHAVKEGVLKSIGNLVMLLDGDCEIFLATLDEYLNEIEDSDLVIGSKRHHLSKVQLPWHRELLSKIFNAYVRLTTGVNIKDTQVGLKIGRGAIIREIFKNIHVNRYAFDVELLAIAALLGLKVKEMPVNINMQRQFEFREIVKMFRDVLAVAYRYKLCGSKQKQFAIIFVPILLTFTIMT
jgi:glycosyltransferase involved in cell wall biosynthesis